MKKILLIILGVVTVATILYFTLSLNSGFCLLWRSSKVKKIECLKKDGQAKPMNDALKLLRVRQDRQALAIFDKLLIDEPKNIDASWGRAEVLRRSCNYTEAQVILNEILKKDPKHIPSLISASYIAYKDNKLDEAQELINRVFKVACFDKNNLALAYMMLGTINSSRSGGKASLLNKLKYGTQIKCNFLRAKVLAPDLPEVHLGLGTFYLLAPAIFGRNIDKAIEELELAVRIAPDFATANARLAQCYKKKGMQDKYKFYISLAKKLDPENEVLRELESE